MTDRLTKPWLTVMRWTVCCRRVIQLVWCGGCWPARYCVCVAASVVKYRGRLWSTCTSTAIPMRRYDLHTVSHGTLLQPCLTETTSMMPKQHID